MTNTNEEQILYLEKLCRDRADENLALHRQTEQLKSYINQLTGLIDQLLKPDFKENSYTWPRLFYTCDSTEKEKLRADVIEECAAFLDRWSDQASQYASVIRKLAKFG